MGCEIYYIIIIKNIVPLGDTSKKKCHNKWENFKKGRGGPLGSDVTIHLVGVFVIVWCRSMHVGAGLAPW